MDKGFCGFRKTFANHSQNVGVIMNGRTSEMATVRTIIDDVKTTCNLIRALYPERYPVPPEVDAMLNLERSLLNKVRQSKPD